MPLHSTGSQPQFGFLTWTCRQFTGWWREESRDQKPCLGSHGPSLVLADPCRHWEGTICHGKEASEEEKDGKKTRHASLAACAEHR